MAAKFCVTLKQSLTDGNKATLAFVVANAALDSDKETIVFLMSDGVWASIPSEIEKVNEGEPFAPLKDLVDKFISGGGKIFVCSTCMKKYGISENSLIKGAKAAGAAYLVSWLSENPACVDF